MGRSVLQKSLVRGGAGQRRRGVGIYTFWGIIKVAVSNLDGLHLCPISPAAALKSPLSRSPCAVRGRRQ